MTKDVDGDTKTAELLVYIASQIEDDETAGQTKLHKILYFSDRAHLVGHGSTITDGEYQKAPQGPTLRRMLPMLEGLNAAGAAQTVKHLYYGRIQNKLVALRAPDLSLFTAEEIANVDRVIRQFWGMNAAETSTISHDDPGWIAAEEGGSIHMGMALIAEEAELSDHIRDRARQLADRHS